MKDFRFREHNALFRFRIALMATVIGICVPSSCRDDEMLKSALKSAGSNRAELEQVLEHYRNDPDKLAAAEYLIAGLPGHYSYADDRIEQYYRTASNLLSSEMSPEQVRDSLLYISEHEFADLTYDTGSQTVSDAQIITSQYLIRGIDTAWAQWKGCTWASQVTFEEFLEWMLPYKMAELQSLDAWRDTLSSHFTGDLKTMPFDDVEYGTTMKTGDMVKNEAQRELNRYGLYTRSGLPLLNAELLARQKFGDIPDYALTGALSLRAAGVPVVLDETPVGARFEAATRWFVVLGDKGSEEPSEWDLSTGIGMGFFPYERGPKVWRNTYAINPDRLRYRQSSTFIYPFSLCKKDVTDKYFLTSDLSIPITRPLRKSLQDSYVYIASAVRDTTHAQQSRSYTDEYSKHLPAAVPPVTSGWQIVDFGTLRHGHARFRNMGREVLYLIYGYDGTALIPITRPFILHKDTRIEYVSPDTILSPTLDKWRNNPLL